MAAAVVADAPYDLDDTTGSSSHHDSTRREQANTLLFTHRAVRVPRSRGGVHSAEGTFTLKAGVDYFLRVAVEATRGNGVQMADSALDKALVSATTLDHHALAGDSTRCSM